MIGAVVCLPAAPLVQLSRPSVSAVIAIDTERAADAVNSCRSTATSMIARRCWYYCSECPELYLYNLMNSASSKANSASYPRRDRK